MIRTKQLLLLLSAATLFIVSDARIRGSKGNENEERQLGSYYKYGRNNNNNRNRNYYYYNQNKNANNYNNNGGGQSYYGNKSNYYVNNKYYNDDNAGNNGDDNGDDAYQAVGDDKWNTYYDDDTLAGTWSNYEKEAQATFTAWYQTPPGDWTPTEWGFLGGIIVLVFGLIVCLLKCCCCCCGRDKRSNVVENTESFDYVGVGNKKSGLLESSRSESTCTDFDDDATFDQVMQLRSHD